MTTRPGDDVRQDLPEVTTTPALTTTRAEPASVQKQTDLENGGRLADVSDYDTASAHLLLAGADPAQAAPALAKLAEVAWIRHDHARGQEYALDGLELDPGSLECREQLRRNESADAAGNALGDTTGLLAQVTADPLRADAVRRCFDLEYAHRPPKGLSRNALRTGDHPRWWDVHPHQLFDERRLAQVNAGDGLIVGGGALFDATIAPNGTSGWQWNVRDEMLRRITVPLVVWSAGFTADDPASERFRGGLRALVQNSAFVGLRDQLSVERVRDLLPGELADRVVWQPCPTALAARLGGPAWERPGDLGEAGPVLLNCGYDRFTERFGDGYGQFLEGLRDWILATRHRAEVRYVSYHPGDERFVLDLRREHGLTLPVIPLYDLPVDRVQLVHRRAALMVGMRSGTVPFGCGTPVIRLGPGRFLADIGRPEWAVPISGPGLGERLSELTDHALDGRRVLANDVERLQQRLFDLTLDHLAILPEPLRVVPRPPFP